MLFQILLIATVSFYTPFLLDPRLTLYIADTTVPPRGGEKGNTVRLKLRANPWLLPQL